MRINRIKIFRFLIIFTISIYSLNSFAQKEFNFVKKMPRLKILDTLYISNLYFYRNFYYNTSDNFNLENLPCKYFINSDSTTLNDTTTLFKLAIDSTIGIKAGWITTQGFLNILKILFITRKSSNYDNREIEKLYKYYGNMFYIDCNTPPSLYCDCSIQFFFNEKEKRSIGKSCTNRFLYISINLYIYYHYFLYEYTPIRVDRSMDEFMKQTEVNLIVPFPVCPK